MPVGGEILGTGVTLPTPDEIAANTSNAILNGLLIADWIAEKSRSIVPIIEDEVTVEVVGQPGATKQELYYLALATANGIVKRLRDLLQLNPLLPPTVGLLMIEYDAADHWVRCTMFYRMSAATGAVLPGFAQFVTNPSFTTIPTLDWTTNVAVDKFTNSFYDGLAVYRGPQCDVIGGDFDFTDAVLPGIPPSQAIDIGGVAPKLPWAHRTILTSCPTVNDPQPIPPITQNPATSQSVLPGQKIPSPNPKPPGDNRSRGTVITDTTQTVTPSVGCCPKVPQLVELVFAALTDPGSANEEVWTPPVQGPLGN